VALRVALGEAGAWVSHVRVSGIVMSLGLETLPNCAIKNGNAAKFSQAFPPMSHASLCCDQ
jgi:hypothetical protein